MQSEWDEMAERMAREIAVDAGIDFDGLGDDPPTKQLLLIQAKEYLRAALDGLPTIAVVYDDDYFATDAYTTRIPAGVKRGRYVLVPLPEEQP